MKETSTTYDLHLPRFDVKRLRSGVGKLDRAEQEWLHELLGEIRLRSQRAEEDAAAWVANVLGKRANVGAVVLIAGGQFQGTSGDPVFMVTSRTGESVAVLKGFNNPDVFAQELSALDKYAELRASGAIRFPIVERIALAKETTEHTEGDSPIERPFLLMTVAKGEPLSNLVVGIARDPERRALLQRAVRDLGAILAQLNIASSGDKVSAEYFIRHRHKLLAGIDGLEPYKAELRDMDLPFKPIRQRAILLADAAETTPGPAGLIHGDTQPANAIFDRDTEKTVVSSLRGGAMCARRPVFLTHVLRLEVGD